MFLSLWVIKGEFLKTKQNRQTDRQTAGDQTYGLFCFIVCTIFLLECRVVIMDLLEQNCAHIVLYFGALGNTKYDMKVNIYLKQINQSYFKTNKSLPIFYTSMCA